MKISKIEVRNFRLLADVTLSLEERTTLIVGRNNSGKTSLTELFRRLLSEKSPSFRLEDFSLSAYENFWKAFLFKHEGIEESKIRDALPLIEVTLTIDYTKDKDSPNLGLLGDFIVDLNPDCTQVLIIIHYQLKDGGIDAFFEDIPYDPSGAEYEQKKLFFRTIKDRVNKYYIANIRTIDPNDNSNQKSLEWTQLRTLIQSGFINAQRGLDDVTKRDKDVLGKVLETLFRTATSDKADTAESKIVKELERAVESIQINIDTDFTSQLKDLLPAFSIFGYPGLSNPRLSTETTLEVERLLIDNTKVHYAGINGINFPEAYNGLGVRNLIFIMLKLYEFFKLFKAMPVAPGIHLVFIEEPEVHLHPQMQEVFIGKIGSIADVFAKQFNDNNPWPVQFVVTTHSSHVVNNAPFDSMRYFLATSEEDAVDVRSTQIKDLREGLGKTTKKNQGFLQKYMTLTRCDLLFADKAILIEGMTERLLMPKMIEKVDEKTSRETQLSSQYISIMEVGGAYAHIFFDLLNFLELRTLIITDLDATKKNGSKLCACKVSEGTHTSNGCIKTWFNKTDISPAGLIKKSNKEKIVDIRRLAYQIPEKNGMPCGRSFEDAFILANLVMFGLDDKTVKQNEDISWDKAQKNKKSDFALEYAIDKTDWVVPRYIKEGLQWLKKGSRGLAITSPPSVSAPPVVPKIDSKKKKLHG